jgi:ABC-2 type transport system ATP-binding protein
MITAKNLTKRYDRLVAVDDISFEIQAGETFGLLGPNGAGKSTTINILSGVMGADAGVVEIDNSDDPTRPQVRRKLGLAPQALGIYKELTGEENISFFGSLYGISGEQLRKRVAWSLEFVGLTDRQSDRAGTYSGGMQRRLNLACAVVHDPPVLFLDEPTVGVDPQSRRLIFDKIEEFKALGRTILYTTHYMEEAERLCDRVAIMDKGKILALDTVENLIAAHGGDAVVEGELVAVPDDTTTLPGTLDGTHLRINTDQPLETIGQLATEGHRFRTLRIDQPDLEKVFLSLTGRRLRD